MYTLSILILILVIYSIYDVKKKSGKWKDFNPFNGNYISVIFSFLPIVILVAYLVITIIDILKLNIKYLP